MSRVLVFELTKGLWDAFHKADEVLGGKAPPITGIAIGLLAVFFAIITIVTFVIDLVLLVGSLIARFFRWLASIFNDTDDDIARERIGRMNCDQIAVLPQQDIAQMLEALLDGPTGDDDEAAILKLVECLPCQRLVSEVWPRFGKRILSDVNGAEHDLLLVLLHRCGLVRFSDWDDDATRLYITRSDCSVLSGLGISAVKELLRNLFSGFTGDADERAILKLIECLPAQRVRALVREKGFSVNDFDDEVDGSEWTALKNVFRAKGVSV